MKIKELLDELNDLIDDLYIEKEEDILRENDEDINYFNKCKINKDEKLEEINQMLNNLSILTDEDIENVEEMIDEHGNNVYDYMMYFTRKSYKEGFRDGIMYLINYQKNIKEIK